MLPAKWWPFCPGEDGFKQLRRNGIYPMDTLSVLKLFIISILFVYKLFPNCPIGLIFWKEYANHTAVHGTSRMWVANIWCKFDEYEVSNIFVVACSDNWRNSGKSDMCIIAFTTVLDHPYNSLSSINQYWLVTNYTTYDYIQWQFFSKYISYPSNKCTWSCRLQVDSHTCLVQHIEARNEWL